MRFNRRFSKNGLIRRQRYPVKQIPRNAASLKQEAHRRRYRSQLMSGLTCVKRYVDQFNIGSYDLSDMCSVVI